MPLDLIRGRPSWTRLLATPSGFSRAWRSCSSAFGYLVGDEQRHRGPTADATGQGKLRKLFRRGQHDAPSTAATNAPPSKTRTNFRRAMSQLFGIIGFLLIVAGLMAAVLGVFYPSE